MRRKLTKRMISILLCLTLLMAYVPISSLTAYAAEQETIIIDLDTNGVPIETNGTGWSYNAKTSTLVLGAGYSYAVNGAACSVVVNNLGTIVGGTYNNTVNNLGDSDTTYKEKIGNITDGIFNGQVINGDGFDICTIDGGTFNGNVTNKNRGVINDGVFAGEVTAMLGSSFNGGSFVLAFETNGGTWTDGYTVPTTYSYASSTMLPTANEISKGSLTFDGWYDNANFDGLPVTEIPAGTSGKLTYYAKFVDGITTWEMMGNTAVENTDYSIDTAGNYTVLTAKGLAKIANIVNSGDTMSGKTVTLGNDIDLLTAGVYEYLQSTVNARNSWIPIDGFAGTFDGNGKKIQNLYVLVNDDDAGLFGSNAGTIKNLELASGKVTMGITSSSSTGEFHVGGIAATTSGFIDNCVNRIPVYVNDTQSTAYANIHVGGVAGLISTSLGGATVSTVSNSTNYAEISSLGSSGSNIYGGGIAGVLFSGRIAGRSSLITKCTNEGDIKINTRGASYSGGISGSVQSNSNSNTTIIAKVLNSKNSGAVKGTHAGGITGYNKNAVYVYNCYNIGDITGERNAGGIVGLNYNSNSTVANCYSIGSITGATCNGGIVGKKSSGTVSHSFYLDTSATAASGSGTVTDCIAFTTSEGTHTLASEIDETTVLLTTLNAWVKSANSSDYLTWGADKQNNNYPTYKELLPGEVRVNGVDLVNDDDDHTITCGNGTASYDPVTKTLTLTNAEINLPSGNTKAGIYISGLSEDFTIKLVGDNSIALTDTAYDNVGIWNYGQADLLITGDGSLDVELFNDSNPFGIWNRDGSITIKDVTMDFTLASGSKSNGFLTDTNENITIDGATFTSSGYMAGLFACGELLEITNGANVNISALENPIYSEGDISIDNSTIVATSSDYTAICGWGDIDITDSTVTATSEYDNGIYCYGLVTVSGGKLEVTSKENDAFRANGGITIKNNAEVSAASTNGIGIYTNEIVTVESGKLTAKGKTYAILARRVNDSSGKPTDKPEAIILADGLVEINHYTINTQDWEYTSVWDDFDWEYYDKWRSQSWFVDKDGVAVSEVTIVKKQEVTIPENTGNTGNTGNADTGAADSASHTKESPKTGDNASTAMWSTLMFGSLMICGALLVIEKKRRNEI